MRSILSRLILGMAAVAFAATVSSVSAQATDPSLGNWKLNLEKSKYSPGPAPKSQTVKRELVGTSVKSTVETVNADDSKTTVVYTANYDGKDVPLEGSPIADTVSLVRKDALTAMRTDKKAGKVVQTYTLVVSKDGKIYTVTVEGTNAKGQPVNNVLVFDRQ
jgi:hypothetical protein